MTGRYHADEKCFLVLVEDSQDEVELLQEIIGDENIRVRISHFPDGQSAYQYFSELPNSSLSPCLMVLDLNLPRMNGKELLEKLNEKGLKNKIRIVIFSGSENPADKHECLEKGAHAYYVKPWDYDGYKLFVTNTLVRELRQVCPEV